MEESSRSDHAPLPCLNHSAYGIPRSGDHWNSIFEIVSPTLTPTTASTGKTSVISSGQIKISSSSTTLKRSRPPNQYMLRELQEEVKEFVVGKSVRREPGRISSRNESIPIMRLPFHFPSDKTLFSALPSLRMACTAHQSGALTPGVSYITISSIA